MADRIASVVRLHSGAARHLKLEFFVASLVAKNLDVVPIDVATMQAGIGTEKSADAVMIDVGAADLVVVALPMMTAGFAAVVAQMSLVVEAYALSVDVAAYLRH